jgi:hypothetical protein
MSLLCKASRRQRLSLPILSAMRAIALESSVRPSVFNILVSISRKVMSKLVRLILGEVRFGRSLVAVTFDGEVFSSIPDNIFRHGSLRCPRFIVGQGTLSIKYQKQLVD